MADKYVDIDTLKYMLYDVHKLEDLLNREQVQPNAELLSKNINSKVVLHKQHRIDKYIHVKYYNQL